MNLLMKYIVLLIEVHDTLHNWFPTYISNPVFLLHPVGILDFSHLLFSSLHMISQAELSQNHQPPLDL